MNATTLNAKSQLLELLKSKGKAQFLDKAWGLVQHAAGDMHPEQFLSRAFSSDAIAEIMPIVEAYEKEIEAEFDAQSKIQDAIAQHERANVFDDDCLDEIDCYAIVKSDCIEVTANVTGMGDRLPKVKGRKYTGNRESWTWEFPLSALAQVKTSVQMTFNEKGERL